MNLPAFMSQRPDGLLLAIKLQPRAAKNEICGQHGNELRIRVTAPPVDAAANEALVRFLSEVFDCPRSCIELVRGQTSPHKLVKLSGLTAEAVLQAVSRSSKPR